MQLPLHIALAIVAAAGPILAVPPHSGTPSPFGHQQSVQGSLTPLPQPEGLGSHRNEQHRTPYNSPSPSYHPKSREKREDKPSFRSKAPPSPSKGSSALPASPPEGPVPTNRVPSKGKTPPTYPVKRDIPYRVGSMGPAPLPSGTSRPEGPQPSGTHPKGQRPSGLPPSGIFPTGSSPSGTRPSGPPISGVPSFLRPPSTGMPSGKPASERS